MHIADTLTRKELQTLHANGTRVTVPHDEARWEAIAEAPRRDGQTVLPAGQASDAGAASPPSSTASRSAPANI